MNFEIIPKELPDTLIRKILKSWHKVNCEFEKAYNEVNRSTCFPYVYNENALTGILALAAYKAGSFPLLNFVQEKDTKTRFGYQDLEILIEDAGEYRTFAIECKRIDVDCSEYDVKQVIKKVVSQLEEARKEAKGIRHRGVKKIAIVFVRPHHIKASNDEELLVSIRKKIKTSKRYFGCVHRCEESLLEPSLHNDSPSIILIGEYVN